MTSSIAGLKARVVVRQCIGIKPCSSCNGRTATLERCKLCDHLFCESCKQRFLGYCLYCYARHESDIHKLAAWNAMVTGLPVEQAKSMVKQQEKIRVSPQQITSARQVVHLLGTTDIRIYTIPHEEWTLSMYRHRTLLVDVYRLTGTVHGAQKESTYECGRIAEILLQFLRYGRAAKYRSGTPYQDENITPLLKPRYLYNSTFEEETRRLLQDGDLLFWATGKPWTLTQTGCWEFAWREENLFYFLDETTFEGQTQPHVYKGSLEDVLLAYLCQDIECVPHKQSVIIPFELKGRGR